MRVRGFGCRNWDWEQHSVAVHWVGMLIFDHHVDMALAQDMIGEQTRVKTTSDAGCWLQSTVSPAKVIIRDNMLLR